jgi:hypothetical protein
MRNVLIVEWAIYKNVFILISRHYFLDNLPIRLEATFECLFVILLPECDLNALAFDDFLEVFLPIGTAKAVPLTEETASSKLRNWPVLLLRTWTLPTALTRSEYDALDNPMRLATNSGCSVPPIFTGFRFATIFSKLRIHYYLHLGSLLTNLAPTFAAIFVGMKGSDGRFCPNFPAFPNFFGTI